MTYTVDRRRALTSLLLRSLGLAVRGILAGDVRVTVLRIRQVWVCVRGLAVTTVPS